MNLILMKVLKSYKGLENGLKRTAVTNGRAGA